MDWPPVRDQPKQAHQRHDNREKRGAVSVYDERPVHVLPFGF